MIAHSPRFQPAPRIEDEKKYAPILRRIFHDHSRLTESAVHACRDMFINPVDLIDKSVEFFEKEASSLNQGQDLPKEIIELRYNHFQNKRRKYFEMIVHHMSLLGGQVKKQTSGWQNLPQNQQHIQSHSTTLKQNQHLPHITSKIQMQATQDDAESIFSHNNAPGNNSQLKKIGRAQFGVLSPKAGMKSSFRSTVTSPENQNKVNLQLMKHQMRMTKEQTRVDRFRNVRINAMTIAEATIQKFQQKIIKDQKIKQRFLEHITQKQEEEKVRREKHQVKLQHASLNVSEVMKKMNQRSLSGYSLKLKEVEEMSNKRYQRDRQHSQKHYQSLRHVIEDEENNSKKIQEQKQREDDVTTNLLDGWQRKMSRGISKAEQYRKDTSSRASRVSILQQETKRQYQSICESELTRSLDKVIKKESSINLKRKKIGDFYGKKAQSIRQDLTSRFERNRSARSMVSDDEKKKGTLNLERMTQKDKLRDILLERQHLEHLKQKEINHLKRADHQNQILKEKSQLNELKFKVVKKIQQNNNMKNDIEQNIRLLQQNTPTNHVQLCFEERQVLDQLDPKQVLLRARMNLTMQYQGLISPQNRNRKKKFSMTHQAGNYPALTR